MTNSRPNPGARLPSAEPFGHARCGHARNATCKSKLAFSLIEAQSLAARNVYLVGFEAENTRTQDDIVIVGLPDPAVKESRDRATTALSNSGFKFPIVRYTIINMALVAVRKFDQAYDEKIDMGEATV